MTLLYSIVLYTFIEEESDAPSYETTIVDQKTVHIENVPLELESDEEFVYVQGNCLELDLEEPITLKVEKDKFVQVNYDEDPGTITPDQQLDILDYLPEEKVVEEDRIDDSIAAISAETAHQIIEVFKNTTNEVEAKKQAGTITQEQYEKQINIVERVIEASVVVGAAQTNAKDEGKKINDALPANSGLGDIGTMLDLFYKTQLDYLLGNRDVPEKGETRKVTREPLSQQTRKIDATCEEFTTMIEYVDTAVSHMKGAALYIRNCSKTETKTVVKSYISRVRVSSFRNFDEEKANNEFVEAVKKAIMLNMQQQVIEALEKDHKPSNNVDKELLYQEQLEAVKDYETFEEIVLEVLRQKYVSLTNQEIEIDTFRGVYDNIFRSWALDDPSLNTSGITLEELTAATIQTTRARANNFTYRETIGKEESIFFIVLGSALVVGLAGAISVPLILRKKRRGLGE